METVLGKVGKADGGRSLALAERLARAMGTELVPGGAGGSAFGLAGFPAVGWRGGSDPLRGGRGDAGLLGVGTVWGPPVHGALRLPPGITKDSSDEELDLTLTAMGF